MVAEKAVSLTPEDLLKMVRQSGDRFQRQEIGIPIDQETSFAPKSVVAAELENFEPVFEEPPAEEPQPEDPPLESSFQDEAVAEPEFTPAPEIPTIDLEAERQQAWNEGHAEAMKLVEEARAEAYQTAMEEARIEAAKEIEDARDVFEKALNQLTQVEHQMSEALTEKLTRAVRNLAAERAGQRIDEAPRPFLRKIEKLAKELTEDYENLVVIMNPADLVAIKQHIQGFSPLAKAKLSPDTRLGRADLRLRMGDITYGDVIAERENGSLS